MACGAWQIGTVAITLLVSVSTAASASAMAFAIRSAPAADIQLLVEGGIACPHRILVAQDTGWHVLGVGLSMPDRRFGDARGLPGARSALRMRAAPRRAARQDRRYQHAGEKTLTRRGHMAHDRRIEAKSGHGQVPCTSSSRRWSLRHRHS